MRFDCGYDFAGGPAAYLGLSSGLPRSAAWTAVWAVAPFAAVAAWRTWVHAERRRAQGHTGWRGVIEAGVIGAAGAAVYLLPRLARPVALPAVLSYVLLGGGFGLAVGLLLRAVLSGR